MFRRGELIKKIEDKIAQLEDKKTKGGNTSNALSEANYEVAISNLYIALAELYKTLN